MLQMIGKMALIAFVTALEVRVVPAQAKGRRSNSTSDGQRLFQHCSGCHSAETGDKKVGPSLKGLFKGRDLLNGTPATERNIRFKIKNGGDGMPSYEQILSAKEVDQVIAYLKGL
jgi:mono/diheme cytochrome c family protein